MGKVLFLRVQTFYFIGNKNTIFTYWCCLCNIFFQCCCHPGLNTLGKLWHTCSKACGTWKSVFCFVMFSLCVSFFYKFMLKVGCKPNLCSNQLQSRKLSFLVKAPSSNVYLRFLVTSSPGIFEAGVKNLHCGITMPFETLKHNFQGNLDVYNFLFLIVSLALQNSLFSICLKPKPCNFLVFSVIVIQACI